METYNHQNVAHNQAVANTKPVTAACLLLVQECNAHNKATNARHCNHQIGAPTKCPKENGQLAPAELA
jgi:hypothetical protein